MKNLLSTIALSLIFMSISAQTTLSGESFDKISLEGHAKVILKIDPVCSVKLSGNDKVMISETNIKNNTLELNGAYGDEIEVSMPSLSEVRIDGNGSVTGQEMFKTDNLKLRINGDGKINLNVSATTVDAAIDGFGKITLNGNAQEAKYSIPGSGKIEAIGMQTSRASVDISGIGKCTVDVTDELTTNISGTGTVTYKSLPKKLNENITGLGNTKRDNNDSINACVDTTRINFGNNQIWVIGKPYVEIKKKRKTKPIWRGFEMGLNSYMDNGGTFTLSQGKENFELRTEKSVSVGLNVLQHQVELGKSNVWIFSGLGVTWNNYRFGNDVLLTNGDYTHAYVDTTSGINHIKSKLVAVYLTAPLMMEVFTSQNRKKAFHIGAGGMFGLRIGSHTKQKNEIGDDISKAKEFDDFNLSTFRYGFRVALGYRKFNIYADYYASTLFKDGKGPTLYPVNIGITFLGI